MSNTMPAEGGSASGGKKVLSQIFDLHSKLTVIAAITIYLAIFSFISLWKYYNFQYDGLDLAIINQVYYNSAQGDWFASSIHPPSYLGDHFSPILLLLLPLYWLWQNPQTLLLLQTLALGLSAWPIYLIAKKVIGTTWASVAAMAWLANPFVQNVNLFEFHDLSFAIPLILLAFYFYQNKRFTLFLLFSVLTLLVREDLALVIAGFGVVAVLEKRSLRWWLWPLLLSVGYFFLAIKIINWAAPDQHYKFLLYYAWLGNSWVEIVKNSLLHPYWLLFRLVSPGSVVVSLLLLLSVACLPLLRPLYLLLGAPIYLQLVLGSNWNWLGMILFTQYSSLLLPGLFIGATYGAQKLQKINFATIRLPKLIDFIDKQLVMVMVFCSIILSSVLVGPLPGSVLKIYHHGLANDATRAKQLLLDQIPNNASVAATFELLTPLSSRSNVSSLNYVFLGKQQFLTSDYALPETTEYLLVDFSDLVSYQLLYNNNSIYGNRYDYGLNAWPKVFDGFGLVDFKNNIGLFKKGANAKATLVANHDTAPRIDHSNLQSVDPNLQFLGYNKNQSYYELFWERRPEVVKNYYLKLVVTKSKLIVYQNLYPLGYGLLNSSANQTKKINQTNYWFDLTGQLPSGSYHLQLDLVQIGAGAIEIDADRSTKNVIDKQTILVPNLVVEEINL